MGEYLDALLEVTRECVRVLKPTGSIWVNLGDKYATSAPGPTGASGSKTAYTRTGYRDTTKAGRPKSLLGIPWRYAIRCTDELGLILRAEVVWSKPNGLPESVTDRVRRSHETWFHFTVSPRYYSAVDEIRQPHAPSPPARSRRAYKAGDGFSPGAPQPLNPAQFAHPVGKLPGSVWKIPTQPLRVPPELGLDHYAAFPMEWPRRVILGWSPREVCTACGQGRHPVVETRRTVDNQPASGGWKRGGIQGETTGVGNWRYDTVRHITATAAAARTPPRPPLGSCSIPSGAPEPPPWSPSCTAAPASAPMPPPTTATWPTGAPTTPDSGPRLPRPCPPAASPHSSSPPPRHDNGACSMKLGGSRSGLACVAAVATAGVCPVARPAGCVAAEPGGDGETSGSGCQARCRVTARLRSVGLDRLGSSERGYSGADRSGRRANPSPETRTGCGRRDVPEFADPRPVSNGTRAGAETTAARAGV